MLHVIYQESAGHGNLSRLVFAVLLAAGITLIAVLPTSASGPTCSDFGAGWENHGHHIVGDYVVGGGVNWPPSESVGEEIGGDGASMPGASGIHQHGGGTFQPGASFCNDQANSPTGQDLPSGRER
jgi:hypothetical protein